MLAVLLAVLFQELFINSLSHGLGLMENLEVFEGKTRPFFWINIVSSCRLKHRRFELGTTLS